MRTKYLVIAAVTILSVLAAVAVAGIPSSNGLDPDSLVPAESSTTASSASSTSAETTSTTDAADADEPTTTPTAVPDPDPPATQPAITEPPATEPPATEPPATEPTTPLLERESLVVVVVNGAAVAGVAGGTADELRELGYLDVRTTDGAEIVEASAVYAAPGLEAEAERLATDLRIDPSRVFPVSATPELISPVDADLIVYLGIDVADR